ncbi:MAG TPA: hypothetical protein VG713_11440, partial [Pirellulales bacterium]|nr:hypothetical protein [Pirellulales bacterium]
KGYTRRGAAGSYALSVFGKPKRETPCDCERSNEPSLLQTVFLRNDTEMFELIDRSKGWLKSATGNGQGPSALTLKSRSARIDQLRSQLKSAEKKLKNTKDKSTIKRVESERRTAERELARLEEQVREEAKAKSAVVDRTPELIREAYLRTFSRYPTEKETALADDYVTAAGDVTSGLRDLLWALMNSKEFVVNH